MKEKLWIVLEGIDGSGKSTLSKLVYDSLIEMGLTGVQTSEPTDSYLGDAIRDVVLFSKEKLTTYQQILLFTADRCSHLDWIHDMLKTNQFIICDRYLYSTLAYQGIDEKIRQSIYTIHDLCLKDYYPDVVYLIDIDPHLSLNRIQKNKKDNFEKVEFLRKVRSRYLDLAKENPKFFEILDGTLPIEKLTTLILDSLCQRFSFLKMRRKT